MPTMQQLISYVIADVIVRQNVQGGCLGQLPNTGVLGISLALCIAYGGHVLLAAEVQAWAPSSPGWALSCLRLSSAPSACSMCTCALHPVHAVCACALHPLRAVCICGQCLCCVVRVCARGRGSPARLPSTCLCQKCLVPLVAAFAHTLRRWMIKDAHKGMRASSTHTHAPTNPHTCAPTHANSRTLTRTHAHMCTNTHTSAHTRTRTHAHTRTHTHTHARAGLPAALVFCPRSSLPQPCWHLPGPSHTRH